MRGGAGFKGVVGGGWAWKKRLNGNRGAGDPREGRKVEESGLDSPEMSKRVLYGGDGGEVGGEGRERSLSKWKGGRPDHSFRA